MCKSTKFSDVWSKLPRHRATHRGWLVLSFRTEGMENGSNENSSSPTVVGRWFYVLYTPRSPASAYICTLQLPADRRNDTLMKTRDGKRKLIMKLRLGKTAMEERFLFRGMRVVHFIIEGGEVTEISEQRGILDWFLNRNTCITFIGAWRAASVRYIKYVALFDYILDHKYFVKTLFRARTKMGYIAVEYWRKLWIIYFYENQFIFIVYYHALCLHW